MYWGSDHQKLIVIRLLFWQNDLSIKGKNIWLDWKSNDHWIMKVISIDLSLKNLKDFEIWIWLTKLISFRKRSCYRKYIISIEKSLVTCMKIHNSYSKWYCVKEWYSKWNRKIIISYWNPRDSVRCVLTKSSYWLRKWVVGIDRFHVMRRTRILNWSKYHWICCWFFFIIFVKYHIFIRLFFTNVYFFSLSFCVYIIFDLSFVDMMTSLEKCNVRYQNWFFSI